MADSKALINGSAYKISGGQTRISGTGRKIKEGKTLISSSGKSVKFENSVVVFDTQGYYFPAYNSQLSSATGQFMSTFNPTSSPTYWYSGIGLKGNFTIGYGNTRNDSFGCKVNLEGYKTIKIYSDNFIERTLSGYWLFYTISGWFQGTDITASSTVFKRVTFDTIPYSWDATQNTYCGTYNISSLESSDVFITLYDSSVSTWGVGPLVVSKLELVP